MGRKQANARHRFIPSDIYLSIEFNPQARTVDRLNDIISDFTDIDPIEVLYVWLVWCTLGILFLPSLLVLLASL